MEKRKLEYLDLAERTFVQVQTSDRHYIWCSFEGSSSKNKHFEHLAHGSDSQHNFIIDLIYLILKNQFIINQQLSDLLKAQVRHKEDIVQEINLVKSNLDYIKNSVKNSRNLSSKEDLICLIEGLNKPKEIKKILENTRKELGDTKLYLEQNRVTQIKLEKYYEAISGTKL